jgi:hypothetical protein
MVNYSNSVNKRSKQKKIKTRPKPLSKRERGRELIKINFNKKFKVGINLEDNVF